MISTTKASRIEAILYIAAHEGMPKVGQTIRHAQGDQAHWSEVESTVTEDCIRTAQAVIDGKLKLPATAAAGRAAFVAENAKTYTITHSGRPNWSRNAQTIEEARAIIRRECDGYMDDAPHFNESDAVELWNESAAEGCGTYAIREVA